jgi:hypothetical protein
MLPDLSERELAGLDALIDEPEGDADQAAENAALATAAASPTATAGAAGASTAGATSHVDGPLPATASLGTEVFATKPGEPDPSDPRQTMRDLLTSVDRVLWTFDEDRLTVDPGAPFSALVAARERALRGNRAGPARNQ